MDRHILFYLVGRLILVNGLSLIIPLTAGLLWGERGLLYFGPSLMAAVALSAFCLYRGRHHKRQVGAGEGAWYMVLVWLILSLLGMLPYVMAGVFTSPADAFFESVSAFTTTGTSVLSDGGAALPSSLLLWHSLMGWLGGLNFILMLVSVMPLVSGCFGLTLSVHQSVSFSPMVASMQESARKVSCIYLVITMFSVCLYWLAGLSPTAAVNQGLMTLSTSGGDSLFDFLRYDSRALEGAGALSMLLASGTTASMMAGIICATVFSRSYPLSVPVVLLRRRWSPGRNLISMSCFYWPLSAAVSVRRQGGSRSCASWCCLK